MSITRPVVAAAVAVAAVALGGCAFLLDSDRLDRGSSIDGGREGAVDASADGAPLSDAAPSVDVAPATDAAEAAVTDSTVSSRETGGPVFDAGGDGAATDAPADTTTIAPSDDAEDDGAPPDAAIAADVTALLYASDKTGWNIGPSGDDAGHDWYTTAFFGDPATPDASISISDAGVLTLGCDACIVSALQSAGPGSPQHAYQHGYFEATMAFNPSLASTSSGWPAWWSLSQEHIDGTDFVDASSYERFAQIDFMQAATMGRRWVDSGAYQTEVNESEGVFDVTCDGGFCDTINAANPSLVVPTTTDYRQFHRYGCLWVDGRVAWLFDGAVLNTLTFDGGSPFAVLDTQHLVLMLQTGTGWPLRIQRIRVWQ